MPRRDDRLDVRRAARSPRPSAERRSRAMCSASSVTCPPRARSVSKMPSPSWKPRSKTDRCGAVGRPHPPVDPDEPGSRVAHRSTSTAPIDDSGPRALATVSSHSSCRVAAPGDAAADVERQPLAVRDERPDEDRRAEPPVGPEPRHRAAVRAAPDRLEALDDLHRPDLGRAGDRAAGERRREEVEGVDAGASRPVTVVTRCWTAAVRSRRSSRGTRTVPGLADPPEVVAQDVHDHHVLGLVLAAGEELAGQRPVLVPRPAARAGALDRVRGDAARPDRPRGTAPGEADRRARGAPVAGDGPRSRYPANSAGSPVRRRRKSGHGSPANGASRRRVRFAW